MLGVRDDDQRKRLGEFSAIICLADHHKKMTIILSDQNGWGLDLGLGLDRERWWVVEPRDYYYLLARIVRSEYAKVREIHTTRSRNILRVTALSFVAFSTSRNRKKNILVIIRL